MISNTLKNIYTFFSIIIFFFKTNNIFIFNLLLFFIFYSFLISYEFLFFSSDILILLNAFLVFSTLVQLLKKNLIDFIEEKKNFLQTTYLNYFFVLKKITLELFYLNNIYFLVSIIFYEIILYINLIILKNLNLLNIFEYSKYLLNTFFNHYLISNIKLELKIKKEKFSLLFSENLNKLEPY